MGNFFDDLVADVKTAAVPAVVGFAVGGPVGAVAAGTIAVIQANKAQQAAESRSQRALRRVREAGLTKEPGTGLRTAASPRGVFGVLRTAVEKVQTARTGIELERSLGARSTGVSLETAIFQPAFVDTSIQPTFLGPALPQLAAPQFASAIAPRVGPSAVPSLDSGRFGPLGFRQPSFVPSVSPVFNFAGAARPVGPPMVFPRSTTCA